MLRYGLLALILGCFAVGCGGGLKEEKFVVPADGIIKSVKSTLEIYAKSGKLGSGITGLSSDINGIASSNPELGAKLRTAFEQLEQSKDVNGVKAKAKEMLGMLP